MTTKTIAKTTTKSICCMCDKTSAEVCKGCDFMFCKECKINDLHEKLLKCDRCSKYVCESYSYTCEIDGKNECWDCMIKGTMTEFYGAKNNMIRLGIIDGTPTLYGSQ